MATPTEGGSGGAVTGRMRRRWPPPSRPPPSCTPPPPAHASGSRRPRHPKYPLASESPTRASRRRCRMRWRSSSRRSVRGSSRRGPKTPRTTTLSHYRPANTSKTTLMRVSCASGWRRCTRRGWRWCRSGGRAASRPFPGPSRQTSTSGATRRAICATGWRSSTRRHSRRGRWTLRACIPTPSRPRSCCPTSISSHKRRAPC
mmetsp:Transcript_22945/g.56700  ORF Transcript_22945/g.56700 Transcript_22945/m.56700 type:complete len:202 (-) Transcript_22945:2271-2876(-)